MNAYTATGLVFAVILVAWWLGEIHGELRKIRTVLDEMLREYQHRGGL